MKHFFLISTILLLSGCSLLDYFKPQIPNPECNRNISALKVFQVLDDYVLADICRPFLDTTLCDGHAVYLQKEKDFVYYDEQVLYAKGNICLVFDGVFQYKGLHNVVNTVPKIKIIDKKIDNPKYQKLFGKKESQ